MPTDLSPGSPDIRPATAADWPVIEALLQALDLPLAGAREHLAEMMVARRGPVVACAGIERYGPDGLLRSVAVDPRCQGMGIGRALVDALLRRARGEGITRLWLLTTTAPDYFAALGFREVERAAVPTAMQASAEFQGACPATARLMSLPLGTESAP
mgnify:CR=1 FL=1